MDSLTFVMVTDLIEDQHFINQKVKVYRQALEECDEIVYLLKLEQGTTAALSEENAKLKNQRWWFGVVGFLAPVVIFLLVILV